MKIAQLTAAAFAALLASSVAFAAAQPPKFNKADANGDGFVDEAEYTASKAKAKFAKLDKDKDGKLSKKEYNVIFEEECE
jgi:opacity protein-like surface antigen